jgi:hypothetical protein
MQHNKLTADSALLQYFHDDFTDTLSVKELIPVHNMITYHAFTLHSLGFEQLMAAPCPITRYRAQSELLFYDSPGRRKDDQSMIHDSEAIDNCVVSIIIMNLQRKRVNEKDFTKCLRVNASDTARTSQRLEKSG